MAAHVEYSNFSSGYAWAKCSDCGWRGTKHLGAGKLSNDQARKEAAAHDAQHEAEEALMKAATEASEAAFKGERDWAAEECEHGLSAWLCEGPMHYPADRPF